MGSSPFTSTSQTAPHLRTMQARGCFASRLSNGGLERAQEIWQVWTQNVLYLVSAPIEPGAFTVSLTWKPCCGWAM